MKKVYVKEEVCMACRLCEVYCKMHHARKSDLVKAFRKDPNMLAGLRVEDKGVISMSVRCQQCADTPCVQACLTGALSVDPATGAVRLDSDKCVGCWTCLVVCPVGAIKQDLSHKRTLRCDLCDGEKTPVCVAHCPNEALVWLDVPEEASAKKV
jgi:anaerobic carbon-monoxide dehydrogenase iron sulfur subunit